MRGRGARGEEGVTSMLQQKKEVERKNNIITALILILCCQRKPQDMPANFMSYDNLVSFRTMDINSMIVVKLLLLNPPGLVFLHYASILF